MSSSTVGAIDTALGRFHAHFGPRGLEGLLLPAEDADRKGSWPGPEPAADPRLDLLADELREYAAGRLREFRTSVALSGTEFQLAVWRAVAEVPYGSLATYGDIARRVGGSARAVGAANGANPVPILVPCHRIIGSDGTLTGYGGGLPLKRRLLELERALLPLG